MTLRIGVSPWGETKEGMERVAEAAFDGGLGRFWLGDGLLGRSDFPVWSGGMESFTELAWLAGRFSGSSVGIGAAVLPLRDSLWLAKEAASLDHLTDGRFTLVLAPGNWLDEFRVKGRDFASRGAALEAGVLRLRQVWSGDADWGDSLGPSPQPYTPGGPPLWLAGARATMLRAIRLGVPFQASRMGPEALAPLAREWFERGGTELAVRVRLEVTTGGFEGDLRGATAAGALVGPASFLADQIGAFDQLGVTDLSVIPGQDVATSLRTVGALVEHVLPALAR